eukprot:2117997-Rhodomonas_salina.2
MQEVLTWGVHGVCEGSRKPHSTATCSRHGTRSNGPPTCSRTPTSCASSTPRPRLSSWSSSRRCKARTASTTAARTLFSGWGCSSRLRSLGSWSPASSAASPPSEAGRKLLVRSSRDARSMTACCATDAEYSPLSAGPSVCGLRSNSLHVFRARAWVTIRHACSSCVSASWFLHASMCFPQSPLILHVYTRGSVWLGVSARGAVLETGGRHTSHHPRTPPETP